jgi:hypothetical protein
MNAPNIQVPIEPIFTQDPSIYWKRPHRHSKDWKPGLGQSTTQLTQEGVGLATTGIVAGSAIAGATAIGAIAGPIGAIAGALIGLLSQVFSGCGQTCVLTSDAANQVEQLLQQNLAAYLASGRTQAEQAAALANFDNTWAKLVQYCGNASFGAAGQNCITDRQAGSCAYHTSAGGWNGCTYTYPGTNGSGTTCWNWAVGYRDPIANDPCVVADTTTEAIASTVNQAWQSVGGTGGISANLVPLLLIAGVVILALVII